MFLLLTVHMHIYNYHCYEGIHYIGSYVVTISRLV